MRLQKDKQMLKQGKESKKKITRRKCKKRQTDQLKKIK